MVDYGHSYKRKILKDGPLLICPSCKSKCFKEFSYNPLVFYSTECKICDTFIGFIKGGVKARKLGSYVRLIGDKKQISIDISLFGDNFDVRKDDDITLLYQLNVSKKRPVLLINHTINEVYYLSAYKWENSNIEVDLTKLFYNNEYFKEKEKSYPLIEFINIDLKADIIWNNKSGF